MTYPLTSLQEGMLFEHIKAQEPGLNLVQILCEVREPLNADKFKTAWQLVADRHPILRTRFRWEETDTPQQEMEDQTIHPFAEHDGRTLSSRDRAQAWEKVLLEDRRRGFELEKAPLSRVAVFHEGRSHWRLCWTFHHLLLDGRGLLLVLEEVFTLYEALERGESLDLPPRTPFYALVEWYQGRDWSAAEQYWRTFLAGFNEMTPLPWAKSSPETKRNGEGKWAECQIELSRRTSAALRTLAQRCGVTVNTVLQGAYGLLLGRYTGMEDVVFGAIRACRKSNVPDAEKIVGLFVNMLPMRVRLHDQPMEDWLRGLRTDWTTMRDFENTPLAQIQRWSEAPRGVRLFETAFNYQEPSWNVALENLGGRWRKRHFTLRNQSAYPLTMDIYGGGRALLCKVNYDPTFFEEFQCLRLLENFRALLENMAAAKPGARLAGLEVLTNAEHRQLLVEWNRTSTRYPRNRCIHELFEEIVRRTPQAVATTFDGVDVTYEKLNFRTNRIARFLQSKGVKKGTLVAICVDRSHDMVAGFLAILKAGGAYVPLDPEYPKERLGFMLEDTQAPVLLTSEKLRDRFPPGNAQVISLDGDWKLIRQQSSDPIKSGATADDLAYVIYTSGSTGIPKGVCVLHRAVVRLVKNTNYIQIHPDDRLAQAANASFDAITFEIWGALLNGARVVGIPKDVLLSPLKLIGRIRDEGITTLFLTTALFNQLAREFPGAFSSLRHLLFGGEAVDPACVRLALQNGPTGRLLHVYGPTETTTFATWFHVTEVAENAATVPIGIPIANTEAYVLDRHGNPVPVGAPGELYLGGDGVAAGYLRRPELTVEKFVPDPFSGRRGARLYRTGDLVRWTEKGQIEFLGRRDHQVKVRGFRIELGEVESALLHHPAVHETVAVVREDSPGDRRLVAYVVTKSGMALEFPRAFLRQRLPEHMMPSAFVVLEKLPLTPNGKVDRKALPKPARVETGQSHVAPRSGMEELVAQVWADVLGAESVGAHDNFFELGGHSILAMRVISRLRSTCQIDLPIQWLFENSTVAQLSEAIVSVQHPSQGVSVPPIETVPRDGLLPFSLFQERIWNFCKDDKENRYCSLMPLRITGAIDVPVFEKALGEIIRRHECLRCVVEIVDGEPRLRVMDPAPYQLPFVDISDSSSVTEELAHLCEEEMMRPFDLRTEPMMRMKLVRLGPDGHEFLLSIHHLLYDTSVRESFFHDLGPLYGAFKRGEDSPLPTPRLQYGDFALWQRRCFQHGSPVFNQQLAYWKQQLMGAPPALNLDFERPKPEVPDYDSCVKGLIVEPDLFHQLKSLSNRQGATFYMTLLAIFKAALREFAHEDDIVVAAYQANRNHRDMEYVMGPQSNLVLLRTRLSGDLTWNSLIDRVRQVVLGAQTHQDIPHEVLSRTCAQEGFPLPEPRVLALHAFVSEEELRVPPWTISVSLPPSKKTMPWGMTLQCIEEPQRVHCYLHYSTDLYDPAGADELLQCLLRFIKQAVADPELKLSALSREKPQDAAAARVMD